MTSAATFEVSIALCFQSARSCARERAFFCLGGRVLWAAIRISSTRARSDTAGRYFSTEHGSGLGTQRWVVEHAFTHLHWFRRLRVRSEIRDDVHEAFLTLGCALICRRQLRALVTDAVG